MLPNDLLEKILLDEEAGKVPVGCQATMINVIEKVIDNSNYELVKKESD